MPNEEVIYPYITFEDGTSVQGSMGQDRSIVWLWLNMEILTNQAFVDLATRFADSTVTASMTYHITERTSYQYSGYTHLTDIIVDPDTMQPRIRLRMKR